MTGKKKNKKEKLSQKQKQEKEAGRAKVTKISLLVFAILALVGIIVSIVLGFISHNAKKPVAFNYMTEDISKYLTIDKDKYTSFDVEVNLEEVTDQGIRNEILTLLNLNKPKDPAYDGKYNSNRALMPGDEVYMFYRGYVVDGDGNVCCGINWDYPTVTKAYAKSADDEPIVIEGGIFTTVANQAESFYNYHWRNIVVERSNVTLRGITHLVEGEGDHGAPYRGFIMRKNVQALRLRTACLPLILSITHRARSPARRCRWERTT